MTEQEKRKELEEALTCDPFEGDRDVDVLRFSDKIVKFRKTATCHDCAGEIQPKTLGRSIAEKFDGELRTFRFCTECTEAHAEDDGGRAITERVALGMQRRGILSDPDEDEDE